MVQSQYPRQDARASTVFKPPHEIDSILGVSACTKSPSSPYPGRVTSLLKHFPFSVSNPGLGTGHGDSDGATTGVHIVAEDPRLPLC